LPKFLEGIALKTQKAAGGKNAVKKDPFLKYGIGIQNFFQL
jgi:hypothetical protein